MSHLVKIYDTCIGCTQCDRVGCKRCESARPTDFLRVRVYLWHETTRRMGLAY
ncbi:unnamed protein product [Withania somnifera]